MKSLMLELAQPRPKMDSGTFHGFGSVNVKRLAIKRRNICFYEKIVFLNFNLKMPSHCVKSSPIGKGVKTSVNLVT